MNNVKVKRADLIARIKKNRDEHHDLFIKAQAGFRERAIEELDEMLKRAKAGDIRLSVRLVPPEDHTSEYDRVLDMLEMSVEDEVTLSQTEFAQFVRNEWIWFNKVRALNATYAMGSKLESL